MIFEGREKLETLRFQHFTSQWDGLPQDYMILNENRIIVIMKATGEDFIAHRARDNTGREYSETQINSQFGTPHEDYPIDKFINYLHDPNKREVA